ncbi:hypothetical protein [Leucobacter sp. Psy1]|uniref:hypothetical protein n=1 Tax=Leucobacter sp. Psy1 TaxID=2875729 RepID=UPI001CD485F5|nr:hypothetical protein [Leucobacter sp. Psy1]
MTTNERGTVMAQLGEPTDEIDGDEELVVTDIRDQDGPLVDPEDETSVETTVDDESEVLEEFGEDVASSPAQRGEDEE